MSPDLKVIESIWGEYEKTEGFEEHTLTKDQWFIQHSPA